MELAAPSPPRLHEALIGLEALCQGKSTSTVRLVLADGLALEGPLIGASPDHVAVAVGGSSVVRRIPAQEIRSLDVAVPRRGREWALAGVGILGATAALVGLGSLPGIGAYLRTHAQVGFHVVFYVGAALLVVLLAKTRLREWLIQWRALYRADDD